MKYYLIVGEASGDLHASRLMQAIRQNDSEAEFRFFGGDLMTAQGGTRVRHYRELAYMGFIPVLLHLPTILRNMSQCKKDILQWQPDVCILVDYPGFNLNIAKYLHLHSNIPVFYYIAPKIWAWKEYRIKNIKRDINELFSILPFEKDFFEGKHNYPIHYVGNPTAEEVGDFRANYKDSFEEFTRKHNLSQDRPIIALLAGSRRQEIKDNLPTMIEAAKPFGEYQLVVAGAPAIPNEYYKKFIGQSDVSIVDNATYELLSHTTAALVTSGTATLETALFNVPQVVCYKTPIPAIIGYLRKKVLKVRYISLVNLIADRNVVPELVAETFTTRNISAHLGLILYDTLESERQSEGYKLIKERLGDKSAPTETARIIQQLISK